jgi:hypothetical protein
MQLIDISPETKTVRVRAACDFCHRARNARFSNPPPDRRLTAGKYICDACRAQFLIPCGRCNKTRFIRADYLGLCHACFWHVLRVIRRANREIDKREREQQRLRPALVS